MKKAPHLIIIIMLMCFSTSFAQKDSSIVENNDGLVPLVLIPAGSFLMGSELGDKNEIPVHKVAISRSFWMSKYEITKGNYYEIMGMRNLQFFSSKQRPIENVTWFEAIKFCSSLSKKEGLEDCYKLLPNDKVECDFTKKGYRLPTEAEWEYACRAGSKTECYSGNDLFVFELVAWFKDNSDNETHEVGLKESNSFGLYDMHGNVWEWCWDGYSIHYYKESPEIDPTGVNTSANKVIRGGSWFSNAQFCRSAFRVYVPPEIKSDDRGFRIVRTQ